MKKMVAMLLVLVMAVSFTALSFAEETSQTESQFETVLLKKGSLIVKNFVSQGTIKTTNWNSIKLQSATLTDVETGSKYFAIRMEHYWYNSQYSNGTSVGVLDYDEIDGAIATLEYVKKHASEMSDYTEIAYTASSGLQIGAYKNSSGSYIFFEFNSSDTAFVEMSELDNVIAALQKAQGALGK